jgi:hypothetical protein
MYRCSKHLFLKLYWHSTRHTTVHFVQCCSEFRKELDIINFENIIIAGFVIFESFCTDVYVYRADYYLQYVQFRTKTITSNWAVNNFQTCSKWCDVFDCSNSKCPSNDEFSNLNCSVWIFHNFARPFSAHLWILQEKLYWREFRIRLCPCTKL